LFLYRPGVDTPNASRGATPAPMIPSWRRTRLSG